MSHHIACLVLGRILIGSGKVEIAVITVNGRFVPPAFDGVRNDVGGSHVVFGVIQVHAMDGVPVRHEEHFVVGHSLGCEVFSFDDLEDPSSLSTIWYARPAPVYPQRETSSAAIRTPSRAVFAR